MRAIKYCLIAVVSVFLSACNIATVPLHYCPASTQGTYTKHTLKVGDVYDDRHNIGDLTNDPREIGEFSWQQSIAPNIYYSNQPVTHDIQTAMHMSLSKAGYKLTSVHPDRVLYTRINKIDLNMEGRDNLTRTLFCRLNVKVAVLDRHDKILWRKPILGEGSVVVGKDQDKEKNWNRSVKKAFNNAMDDLLLQIERSKGFNKALR